MCKDQDQAGESCTRCGFCPADKPSQSQIDAPLCPFAQNLVRFSKNGGAANTSVSRVRSIDEIPDWVLNGG